MTEYSFKKTVNLDFADAVLKTKEELQREGFGVLFEIDVKDTLRQKLGISYDPYLILGVCNPDLAHKALRAEKEIGLFLPCNVIVYEDSGAVKVSTILPVNIMKLAGNESLNGIAADAQEKLKKAIDAI